MASFKVPTKYRTVLYAVTSFASALYNDSFACFLVSYLFVTAATYPLGQVYPDSSYTNNELLAFFVVSIIAWFFGFFWRRYVSKR